MSATSEEINILARRLLERMDDPRFEAIVNELLAAAMKEPDCAKLLMRVRDELQEKLEGDEEISGIIPAAIVALLPAPLQAGVSVLELAAQGVQGAVKMLSSAKKAAAAGDPKGKAAVANLQKAAKVLNSQGKAPAGSKKAGAPVQKPKAKAYLPGLADYRLALRDRT